MDLKLPAGFKFDPSDKQLLENYLIPKIQGTLSWNVIQEKEIYGPDANPWEIFNDSSTQWITSGNEKSVYVFTRLTKMADKESSGKGSEVHYLRTAGCGTWHVETGRKTVMDGKDSIGEKRMLVFQINDVDGVSNGVRYNYWKMHEYFLKGYADYVVCRITVDVTKVAKVCTKDVTGRRGSTKSKANRKMATTQRTTEDEGKNAVVDVSFCDPGKELVPIQESGVVVGGDTSTYGVSSENQTCHEENSEMMIYQNMLAPTNALRRYGSDQRYGGMPQYYDDQIVNNEEGPQPGICMGGGFQNPGAGLSDFNGGFHEEGYLNLDDMFGNDFWTDMDNVLMEQPMPNNDVSLDFEDFFDAGFWSDKRLDEPGQVNNNVQEQQQQPQEQQQQPQQPTQNISCVLGKRGSFEVQEAGSTKRVRI